MMVDTTFLACYVDAAKRSVAIEQGISVVTFSTVTCVVVHSAVVCDLDGQGRTTRSESMGYFASPKDAEQALADYGFQREKNQWTGILQWVDGRYRSAYVTRLLVER